MDAATSSSAEAVATTPEAAPAERIPAVKAEGVSKSFRLPLDQPSTFKQRVLHPRQSRAATQLDALVDVSFEVKPGEFFGIIGRNGSGKSTMLKILAGIYEADAGTVSVAGPVSPFIELGVGFTPELTARDNVVVNAALLGMPRAEALARFDEIIRFAELERFVDLKLKNYSSGMQVRLGFAAAIQADADVYIVDEVLAVGDARFQEKCFDTFRRFKREGQTVIYVTHDLGTVERFCDRALLLEGGRVADAGDPRDVIRTYRQHDLELAQRRHSTQEQTSTRWGDGSAEIVDAWFEDAGGRRQEALAQGDQVTFCARIRFTDTMEQPVFGVIVRNEERQHVFVTNTMFDAVETGTYGPGDEAVYRVSFALEMAHGHYTASPAVAYEDSQRFADWREDFAGLSVSAARYSGGIVDLPHSTDVSR
jgi:ABC-type polysaccharide/polyol phosphate transport system ATPase subunit